MSHNKFSPSEILWRSSLFDNQIRCDTTLQINDFNFFKIGCHWLILCADSDFFKAMHRSNNLETQPGNNITIGLSISPPRLRAIIRYLYTRQIDLDDSNCYDCLRFAHMYLFDCLFQRAKQFFLQEINLFHQPTDVLLEVQLFLTETEIATVEQKIIKQLLKLDSIEWMASAAFLALRPLALNNFISRADVPCREEFELLNAIVQWWRYDPENRDSDLIDIMNNALNTCDLSAAAVKSLVSSCDLPTTHPLANFANTLPINSITRVRPARTNTDIIDCFELIVRHFFHKISCVLIDVSRTQIQYHNELQLYYHAEDITHAAGLMFVQTHPFFHFEQLNQKHMPALKCDILFELDYKEERTLIMLKFNGRETWTDVKLTICQPFDTHYEVLREGQLTVPATQWYDDPHFYQVHGHHLYAIHGKERTVLVYDLLVMQVQGRAFIDIFYRSFPVVAKLRNIFVLTSALECYVFDFDKIAVAARSDLAEFLAPLAKFPPPVPINNHNRFSAELIGDRFVFVIVRIGETHMYTCDFASVLHHGGTRKIAWQKQVFVLPFNNFSDNKINWVDLQRRKVNRHSQRWEICHSLTQ